METILLVEDDRQIVEMLRVFLQQEGFQVWDVPGQAAAMEKMEAGKPDLLLVDISLQDGNGFAVCSAAKSRNLPVIFLTASGDEYSVVAGLDMGADDYVAKPFRPRELVSRIRSVLRRTGGVRQIICGDLTLDLVKGRVCKAGQDLFLSTLEYRLLTALATNRGQTLSRSRLLEEIWDAAGEFVNDNTLTVYIKRLREKIEDNPQAPRYIVTVRGAGYRML